MGLFGKIGKAIGGAVKAIGNGLKETVKQVGLFAEGVVSGLALKPIAGVVSLFSKDLAEKIRLPNQEEVDRSFMGKIGSFAGTALSFVGGTALLRGVGVGATIARSAMGAVQGLAGTSEGSFWDKVKGATFGALTAGAAGKLGDKVAGWLDKGKEMALRPLVGAGAPRVVTQGVDRFIDAELRTFVRTGKFGDFKDVLPAIAVSTVASETGDHIRNGINNLMDRLPDNEVTDSLGRVLHAEHNSLAQRGRFAEPGLLISQAIPDSVHRQIDQQITRLNQSDNRISQTAGQFLHNEATMLRVHGRLIDPQTVMIRAAANEFAPEINKVIDGARNMNNPVGDLAGHVLRTEADSLQHYGRLYNPSAALQRAVMNEVRPAIDRFEQRLPSRVRSTADDMLNGFMIDGIENGATNTESTFSQAFLKHTDRILSDRIRGPEHVEPRSRFDNKEQPA